MRTISSLALAVTFFLVSAAACAGTAHQLSDNQAPDYPTVIGDRKFADLVYERTNGRIVIDVYDSATLFEEKAAIEATQSGDLAFCRVNAQPLSDFTPALGVLSLPYIFRDEDHLWKILNGPIGEELLEAMQENGLIGLAYYDSGSRSFYNSRREVKTPADMKGLKIRVQQSKLMMGMVSALGATPTPMPFGEVFTGLQSGAIDGAENNWPSYYSTSHWEVAKYFSLDHHTRTPEVLCMSRAIWETLSPEDRMIVKDAAVESQATQREAWKEYEAKSIKALTDSGKVVITEIPDLAAWQEAVKPVYSTIDLGPRRDEYVKRIGETE